MGEEEEEGQGEERVDSKAHRREGLDDGVLVVLARLEETVEDVIRVGCNHKVAHWETHPLGVVPSQDVTKVASGN